MGFIGAQREGTKKKVPYKIKGKKWKTRSLKVKRTVYGEDILRKGKVKGDSAQRFEVSKRHQRK